MKLAHKNLIAAGLLAAFGFAAVAQTAPPVQQVAPQTERIARMQERMAKHQTELKQKLQLNVAQEGAWNTYVAALKPVAVGRPDRAEFATLSTPERIDRMRIHRAARAAEMDKRGEATKAFYAALSPEQKKLFDNETARRGHGGHHGRHHKA